MASSLIKTVLYTNDHTIRSIQFCFFLRVGFYLDLLGHPFSCLFWRSCGYSSGFETCQISRCGECDPISADYYTPTFHSVSVMIFCSLGQTHSRIDPEKGGVVWGSTRKNVELLAGLKCTGVKKKQVWRSEEKIVSVWSERDYLVSASSRADARISAHACTSEPVNLCESVCTPAIFQLAFIWPARSVFSCPNTTVQAVWKKVFNKRGCACEDKQVWRKTFFCLLMLVLHYKNRKWSFYTIQFCLKRPLSIKPKHTQHVLWLQNAP